MVNGVTANPRAAITAMCVEGLGRGCYDPVMKRIFIKTFSICCLLLAVLSLAPGAMAGSNGTAFSIDGDGVAIGGYDPVAYLTVHEATKGSPDHTYDWSGARGWFASAGNRVLFAADPEAYAPVFGGWCAMAMTSGQVVEADYVDGWSIHDGRLYLNVNADVNQRWRRSATRLVPRAEREWPDARASIVAGEAEIVWQSVVPDWY